MTWINKEQCLKLQNDFWLLLFYRNYIMTRLPKKLEDKSHKT